MSRRSDPDDYVQKVEEAIRAPLPEEPPRLYLPTGSTLWNLALSDDPFGGLQLAHIHRFCGGPSSGKTFALWTSLAEALHSPEFSQYEAHYRDIERSFTIARSLFGEKIARVIFENPEMRTYDNVPVTIQDWRVDLHQLYERNKPFIYGLDSFDALDSIQSQERLKKADRAIEKGNKPNEGGYKTEKAEQASVIFREAASAVKKNNSILLIVSQKRDKIDAGFWEEKETTSGGNAPEHYSHTTTWFRQLFPITKEVNDSKYEIGVMAEVEVRKNKQTGKKRSVRFPIYYSYGIDDIGSMIDWMVAEGFWAGAKKLQATSKIDTRGDFIEGTKKVLIGHIEENNLEDKLRGIVGECWAQVEAEVAKALSDRKPRYGV